MDALIIIDMANAWRKDATKRMINKQLELAREFKRHKKPVILALPRRDKENPNPVMLKLWGDELAGGEDKPKGEKPQDLIHELRGTKPDKIVRKKEYSAFHKTDLEEYCKRKGADRLFLTGLYSGVCVHYTGADAAMDGIMPVLVTDATATTTKGRHTRNVERFREVLGGAKTTAQTIKAIKPVTIRRFKPGDAAASSRIIRSCFDKVNNYPATTTEKLKKSNTARGLREKSLKRTFYVAEDEDGILGIAGFQDDEVKTVFVKPGEHGRGVGRKLMGKVLAEMGTKGHRTLTVFSSPEAEGFYERFGFEKVRKETLDFKGSPLAIVRMTKKL